MTRSSTWWPYGVLLVVMQAAFSGCHSHCEDVPDDLLYYYTSRARASVAPRSVILWDTTETIEGPGVLYATFPDVTVMPSGVDMFELYDGAGARRTIGAEMFGVFPGGDVPPEISRCPYAEMEYSLESLPNGRYTLVHRLSSAPDGYMVATGGFPIETFEGEPALVTEIILRR
jgi:hypothetical protein